MPESPVLETSIPTLQYLCAILGINSPSKDQIDFRRVTTCKPITQENYTTKFANNIIPESFDYTFPGNVYFTSKRGASDRYTDIPNQNITLVTSHYEEISTSRRKLRYYAFLYYVGSCSHHISRYSRLSFSSLCNLNW
ncbi:hypothetical protein F4782DRAFT_491727 [Xylaria castorea]|nr:hypothetical protein F4782DRAFT_491727 [Xylaria castorea]